MERRRYDYRGHRIELRAPDRAERRADEDEEAELLVDDEPVAYDQLPDGSYYLSEYAYDWTEDLVDLAHRLIDHRDRADEARRSGRTG